MIATLIGSGPIAGISVFFSMLAWAFAIVALCDTNSFTDFPKLPQPRKP